MGLVSIKGDVPLLELLIQIGPMLTVFALLTAVYKVR